MRGGPPSVLLAAPPRQEGEDGDKGELMYFHGVASTLSPTVPARSQLAEAGGLPAPPASRHSAIVQNGIGPRKLGACENRYEFCKTALRR